MSEIERKTVKLNPDQFTVDENGKVVIRDGELAELIKHQAEENNEAGSVGVEVSVGVSIGAE